MTRRASDPAGRRPQSTAARATPRKPATRRSFRARAAVLALGSVAALFMFVYPSRSLLQQRREANHVQDRIELLRSENQKLESEQARLESDAEVERRAREEFSLVRPGEKAYVIVPGSPTGTTTPSSSAESGGDEVP